MSSPPLRVLEPAPRPYPVALRLFVILLLAAGGWTIFVALIAAAYFGLRALFGP